MKHENIIVLIALTIFWMASVEIAFLLPFVLGEVYVNGGYTFDLALVTWLLNVYGGLVLVVMPIYMIWVAHGTVANAVKLKCDIK